MRRRRFWSTLVALVALTGALVVTPAPVAQAAQAGAFDPGNLISDENFFAGSAMDAASVQRFLTAQQPGCATGYTCLDQYAQATPTMAGSAYCNAMPGSARESASSIIARVGAACGISQRVLLVLLQKEQSLVTDRDPTARQFERATGFACPDTAPCDASFGGFFYQVYYAARQFKVYAAFPANYNHLAGRYNSVLYNPQVACGSSPVYIANQATAGLYNYTPYQPNAAALNNLYGAGDACSAYGNRNFWRMWTDWFGNPSAPSGPPFGNFESAVARGNVATVSGWAIDPDVTGPVDVHVYVSNAAGRVGTTTVANLTRTDVGGAYPAYGSARGFSVEVSIPEGASDVCVAAINQGGGENVWLGCKGVTGEPTTGRTGPPFGSFEGAVARGSVATVSGWAIDPDVTGPVNIHVYVSNGSGRVGASTVANLTRQDVGSAYPGYGPAHGFSIDVPIPAGTSEVCVAAINQRAGNNVWLGCKSVTGEPATGRTGPPFGNLEAVTATETGAVVSGWVIDPDTAAATDVHIYVDGRGVPPVRADGRRNDVGAAYPVYGPNHGFSKALTLAPGKRQVCVFGINSVGPGEHVLLGCRDVVVAAPPPTPAPPAAGVSPFGNLEATTVRGSVAAVSGWAIDPDVSGPIDVHVYVSSATGRVGTSTVARLDRPDVARAYPAYGPAHGFAVDVPIPTGSSEICVAAINSGGGSNVWLACRTVTR